MVRNPPKSLCLQGFFHVKITQKLKNYYTQMENGLAIDTLHTQLLDLTRQSEFGFDALRSTSWGRVNSDTYNILKSQFVRSMRQLAKKAPVKYYKGSYYIFNGKIYESVPRIVLEQTYQLLLLDLAISPMIGVSTVMNKSFIDVIECYNILHPSFDIVAFSNGVVDFGRGLQNPAVMPFSPDYHVTYYHPYDFNPKAKCDRWMNFIHEVLPDRTSRMILQMFLGLGLIQRGTAYNPYEGKDSSKIELCLLLIGTGANGKSVIFDVACNLFGKDRISKMDYADLTAEGDEGMRGRYPIRNAIFNWSSDSDPRKFGRKNTGMFKRLVSGEPVPMRELGRNVLEANNIPYLIFNLNELPFPEDASLGFIRRLQYVSFDVTVPKERQDPELSSKIIRRELSGVFNWVMRGAQELRKRKYRFPAAEGSAKQLLLSLLGSQPIYAWIRAYGIRSDAQAKGEVSNLFNSTMLYECMRRFCAINDVDEKDIPSMNKFGRDMWAKYGFFKKRTKEGNAYQMFGVTEADLKQDILINEVCKGEEDNDEPESFIKGDD